ncbi:MAG: hypothetical protein ACI8XM_001210 [Haloarculaceae archaeon]|jgi:hypothetical protein
MRGPTKAPGRSTHGQTVPLARFARDAGCDHPSSRRRRSPPGLAALLALSGRSGACSGRRSCSAFGLCGRRTTSDCLRDGVPLWLRLPSFASLRSTHHRPGGIDRPAPFIPTPLCSGASAAAGVAFPWWLSRLPLGVPTMGADAFVGQNRTQPSTPGLDCMVDASGLLWRCTCRRPSPGAKNGRGRTNGCHQASLLETTTRCCPLVRRYLSAAKLFTPFGTSIETVRYPRLKSWACQWTPGLPIAGRREGAIPVHRP